MILQIASFILLGELIELCGGTMPSINTPIKTEQGWVVDIPSEIADSLGVAEGSIVTLQAKDGRIEVEILPPPSPDLVKSSRRIFEKYKDAFEGMKRLGD